MYIKKGDTMTIIFKDRETFNTIQIDGCKSVSLANGTYTVTKSDNSTATYSAATYLIWIFQ